MAQCKSDQIVNPLTGRCVKKTGRVGKKIDRMPAELLKVRAKGATRENRKKMHKESLTAPTPEKSAMLSALKSAAKREKSIAKHAMVYQYGPRSLSFQRKTTAFTPCKKSTEERYLAKDGSWRCRRTATNTLRSLNWSGSGLPKKFGAYRKA